MGKNSKHHRKKNQLNNKDRKRLARDLKKDEKAKKYAAVKDKAVPEQRYLWPEIPNYVRRQNNVIDFLLPVRTREGRPAVIESYDPRQQQFVIRAAALRGDGTYLGEYSKYGEYIPMGNSNPLDLFNVSLSDWREKMGRNWDLSMSRKKNEKLPV